MIACLFVLGSLISSFVTGNSSKNSQTDFNFFFKDSCITSAGVYTNDGKLVRTLWSGVVFGSGNHWYRWDRLTDDSLLAPQGDYQIKILSNNIKIDWEGVIGNTSAANTGDGIFRAIYPIQGITVAGEKVFYATGYNEQVTSTFAFEKSKPYSTTRVLTKGLAAQFVASDGDRVFWAGREPGKQAREAVFATSVADGSEVVFKYGSALKVKNAREYKSLLNTTVNEQDSISGLAVQRSGRFLFVAHKQTGVVKVFDKVSGAFVNDFKINSPGALDVDGDKGLWICYKEGAGFTVGKFSVSPSGKIISENSILKGLKFPVAIAVSASLKQLIVADAGTSQQLKSFNTTNGELKWVLGREGGYLNDPSVSDDKFYFSDARKIWGTSIATEEDGSFWVVDKGNYRLLKYSRERKLLNQIMYLPTTYSISVDANNPNRVFADYLEFAVDYKKQLGPANGSWKLVRNWGSKVKTVDDNRYARLKYVTTMLNGRTYALIGGGDKPNAEIVELQINGPLRFTGKKIPKEYQLYPDGSLRKKSRVILGKPFIWTRQRLLNFDRFHTPVWGEPEVLVASPPASPDAPLSWGSPSSRRAAEVTSSNVLVSFDETHRRRGGVNWHLGGIRIGEKKWLWRTAIGTPTGYNGEFPDDGAFDNGNYVRNPGSLALTSGRFIFWGYHGEGWKGGEVNKWNIIFDNGLFLKQFGVTGREVKDQISPAGMAGNAISAAVTGEISDCVYLYHNDESIHGGLHRWRISNIHSVKETVLPVSLRYTGTGLLEERFVQEDLNRARLSSFTDGQSIPGKPFAHVPRSARQSGYILIRQSDYYRFSILSSSKTRIWINNKVVFDNGFFSRNRTTAAPVHLEENCYYAVKIESQDSVFSKKKLMWSKTGAGISEVPLSLLTPETPAFSADTLDLLKDLPFNQVLTDPLYGWSWSPLLVDISDRLNSWWKISTNVRSYDRFSSPDISVAYRRKNGSAVLYRDLGTFVPSGKKWKLNGVINYTGCSPNSAISEKDPGGGAFIDVLDSSDEILIRLYTWVDYKKNLIQLRVNDKVFFSLPRDSAYKILNRSNEFTAESGREGIKLKFGNFLAFLPHQHVSGPQKIRISFWSNGNNDNRQITIGKLYIVRR